MSPRPPTPLPRLYRWRTNLLHIPLMAVSTVVCGSASLAVSLIDKSGRVQHRIARVWARSLIFFAGCSLSVRGSEHLKANPVAVYASNHTSYMDTPVVFASLPFQFRILAKKELWPIAFIGWYLDRSGQIPIDTRNPRATLSSLSVGVKALRAGMPLFVFPEGGRTPDGAMQNFLSGAAYLAIRAQVPLVPIALLGADPYAPFVLRALDADCGRANLDCGPDGAADRRADRAAARGDPQSGGADRYRPGRSCAIDGPDLSRLKRAGLH
jgi:1-acyl-sn-glycerol-3-phosphate acyltransferase